MGIFTGLVEKKTEEVEKSLEEIWEESLICWEV